MTTFLGSTHVVEQFSFSIFSSIMTFDFDLMLGSFFAFWRASLKTPHRFSFIPDIWPYLAKYGSMAMPDMDTIKKLFLQETPPKLVSLTPKRFLDRTFPRGEIRIFVSLPVHGSF